MAGEGGGSKPILQIPIDDSAWQEFMRQFGEYQQKLANQGSAWASTNDGIKKFGSAFENAEESFDDVVKSAQSPKLTQAFAGIDKTSKETSKSWLNISKTIEKSSKDLAGMLRDGGKFSALGGFLGLGGAAVGASAVFGAVKSANDSLADQNILNRKLGLKPGEEPAFANVYEKAGGDDALLHKVANAQAHQDQWKGFMALGLSQDQITGMDPAHLAAEVLKRGGEQFNARGASTGLWADATGVSSLMDVNSMRLAGSYQGQFGDMGKQFEDLVPKLAADQKALEEATAARQKLDAALAKDELELHLAFIKLNPLIIKGAEAVTGWVTAFAESKDLDKDIKEVSTAFDELATAGDKVVSWLNHLLGLDDKNSPNQKTDTVTVDKDSLAANFMAAFKHPIDYFSGKDRSAPGWSWNYGDATENLVTGKGDGGGAGAGGAFNNPGNLEVPGKQGQFQKFTTADAGVVAMDKQMMLYAKRDHLDTLQGIIGKYAPASDHNDVPAYVRDVAGRTGFDPTKPLDMNDPAIRAAIEAAMIRHENGTKYSQFDQQHINDLLTGKATPDDSSKGQKVAFEKKAKTDDPMGSMQILPFTDADARAKADYEKSDQQVFSESVVDRMTRAAGMLRDTLREGGGSAFRMPDAQTRTPSNTQQAPYNVNVTVTTPAGSSTTVTAGTLVQ